MSYTNLLYHIIFRTKHSRNTISENSEKELYRYIWGIIKNKKSILHRIGGTENHVHLLVTINPMISISSFMQEIKGSSSKWLAKNSEFPLFEGWSSGYACFTYNLKEKKTIKQYVENQKIHHKKEPLQDEYSRFLVENGIEIDERYFFKD